MIKEKNYFAIYVSTKIGQFALDLAFKVYDLLKSKGKIVYFVVGNNLTNDKLKGYKIDVLVNTACPRIKEDYRNYDFVLVNVNDIFKAFGYK